MKTKIFIIYPTDPLGSAIGGIGMHIKGFIKFAPEDFEINFIGISSDAQKRPAKKWTNLNIGERAIKFFPLFFIQDENKKTNIPLSLRFALLLYFTKVDISNKLLLFERIEPAILQIDPNIPRIAIIHNDIEKQLDKNMSEVLWSHFPWIYFLVEKFIFKKFDHIYTVSNNSLQFYRKKYSAQKEKFSFLPTWVDGDIFCPTNESKVFIKRKLFLSKKRFPNDEKLILFVGRLQKQKAPVRLIDAFYEYYKTDKSACFLIIGEGNLKTHLKKHIKKLDIEKNVLLLGRMDPGQLVNFYRASDVVMLTSNYEGMPIVMLEALACGTPIVTTDAGEVRLVIKNGFSGEVVDGFDSKNIAKALQKVIGHPEIYSKDNCVHSAEKFTPQRVLGPVYKNIRKLFQQRFGNVIKTD